MSTFLLVARALAREAAHILRHRAPLAGLAVILGVALPLGASLAIASPGHEAPGHHVLTALAEPALAAPEVTASASPDGTAPTATVPVHLPLFSAPEPIGPAPVPRAGSRLVVQSVGLQVGVIEYSDCSGKTPMTRSSAVRYTCTPAAVTAFVGHNPGVFTPLLNTHPGDRVVYQHDGVTEAYLISAPRRVSPAEAAAATQDGSYVHAVFATCAEPDSSAYWIFTATPVNGTGATAASTGSQGGQGSQGGGGSRPAPSPSPSPAGGGGPGAPLPVPLPSPPPPPI